MTKMAIVQREEWLLQRCKDRSVVHLGCTDSPLTAERLKTGRLLHQRLLRVARLVVGVDIDAPSLELLAEANIENIHHLNIEELHRLPLPEEPEIILAGEVVEHLDNVGAFLDSCMQIMTEDTTLIITVPNAFSFKRFLIAALTGREHVHPDHTAYFSPSTLLRIATRRGLGLQLRGYIWENPTLKNAMVNRLARLCIAILRSPILADGLIAELTLKKPETGSQV